MRPKQIIYGVGVVGGWLWAKNGIEALFLRTLTDQKKNQSSEHKVLMTVPMWLGMEIGWLTYVSPVGARVAPWLMVISRRRHDVSQRVAC